MSSKNKPDIPKIIFAGLPILLIWWGVVFIALAVISRDLKISKYGSLTVFLLSIPIYDFLSIKYASKLGATVGYEDQNIRKSKVVPQSLKRNVTKFDLWFAGIFICLIPLYFIIGQYVFGFDEDQLSRYIKWVIPFAICLEVLLRKKIGKFIK